MLFRSTSTAALPFTIGDVDSAMGALTVTATSSNLTLVSEANLLLSGSDSNRAITIVPTTNAIGTTLITLFVTDGQATNSTSFLLTVTGVNDAPTISALGDQTIPEDTTTEPIPFSINDLESAPGALIVSATSSNVLLVPMTNIVLAGSDSNRTVVIQPATNQFGTTLITILVSDGEQTNSSSFLLTVSLVNDPP